MPQNILFLMILLSCVHSPKQESRKTYLTLSQFYLDTTFKDLFVYPDTSFNESLYFFKGNQLDFEAWRILPDNITRKLPHSEGFYANFSFQIDTSTTGLITRVPAEYSSSAVSLWLYNNKLDSITNSYLLSDQYGDAGTSEIISSYLFFDEQDKFNVLSRRALYYDHGVEDEGDTTIEKYHYFTLVSIMDGTIVIISKDSSLLHDQFGLQLKKLASY